MSILTEKQIDGNSWRAQDVVDKLKALTFKVKQGSITIEECRDILFIKDNGHCFNDCCCDCNNCDRF